MLKNLVFIVCLVVSSCAGFAQSEKTFPFSHYNFNNGLAAYNANTIVQDNDGFIWIGTVNGLQRFDGHGFITFRKVPGDHFSIPDNYIDHLFYDSKGNLWLVLGNGQIGIFDRRRFRFTPITLIVQDERTLKSPRKLMEDSDGTLLYIIYGHEIVTYNPLEQQFSPAFNKVRLPPYWKAMSLVEDPQTRKYWIGTDSGMYVFNRNTKIQSFRGHNGERIPFIDQFGGRSRYNSLMIDSSGKFWYTNTPPGSAVPFINCYDLKTSQHVLYQQNLTPYIKKVYDIKRILQLKNGDVWIAGLNTFMKFNHEEKKFKPIVGENSAINFSFQEINCLLEDSEHNIWVSTDNSGLYIFKPTNPLFTSIRHYNRTLQQHDVGVVTNLTHTNNNQILAAVWGDGIHKYDSNLATVPETKHTADEKKSNTIWTFCKIRDGKKIWLGLQSGIMIYDIKTGKGEYRNPPLFQNQLVRTIAEDKQGNVWVGCPGAGVFKWDPKKAKNDFDSGFTRYNRYMDQGLVRVGGMPNTHIEKITVDSKGNVWVCTLMNGVFKINPVTDSIVEHLTTQGPWNRRLQADAVTDAFEYNDSIMVFATGALNIYNTKARVISQVSSANGLPSDIVRSIEKDNKGFLWLAMFNGLCRMDVQKNTFTYYDRNDGMLNDNFLYSSSCKLPDGRLAFGTTTDFIVFNPAGLNTSVKPPDVTITSFEVLNRQLLLDSLQQLPKIELEPEQNFITISFSGLSYQNNKFSYYYMLDGLDKTWKRAENMNQVSYNYLPAGNYTFRVKTQNPDGVSSENVTELKFWIEPSLLQSWWFYSVIALLLAIVVYIIDRERMRRKQSIQKMRSDIADNLHEEVNTALNRINILSEMARIKSEKDPERSTDYFEQIHKKSHDMIIAMDDMLWSIDPANDNMMKTLERIREYIDSVRSGHSVTIDLLVEKNVETLALNMKLRHDVFMMMKEGIRSVIQAGTKRCKIHVTYQKDVLMYTLEIDNKDVNLQHLINTLQQINLERRLDSMKATLKSKMHRYTSIFEMHVPVS